MPNTLYLRGLRQADHTVFCVQDGQKHYYDPVFNRAMPYSSGQQVKRSLFDLLSELLGEQRAPIEFNHVIESKGKNATPTLGNKEPWSPCDPTYVDQLLGGWMKAKKSNKGMKEKNSSGEKEESDGVLKRRSPLSISAMRPLHPLLAELSMENITFDRSDHPEHHKVRVVNADGQVMSDAEVADWLHRNDRTLPRRHWIPKQRRASGLFVYDIAIDLTRLFKVSVNQHDPELDRDKIGTLKAAGWELSADGEYLLCPEDRCRQIIPALAHALVHWSIGSNQARTYSPMQTLALAVSDKANRITGAIRADLDPDQPERKALPTLEPVPGVDLFVSLPARGYVPGVSASATALEDAEALIAQRLTEALAFRR